VPSPPAQVGGQLPGGLLLRGLSGGERKRLSIAAGIIATPSVVRRPRRLPSPAACLPLQRASCQDPGWRLAAPQVFLDEPTSGLDSFAALTVMGHLKRMAGVARQVVLASIHQPRAAIWGMFDTVGGRMGGASRSLNRAGASIHAADVRRARRRCWC
jgi:ATP-binding cassette subfamily G (WHITE) protein 2